MNALITVIVLAILIFVVKQLLDAVFYSLTISFEERDDK